MTELSRSKLLEHALTLPVAERIELMHDIWESIAKTEAEAPISEEDRELIDRRLAEHLENPEDAVDWEDVKQELIDDA